MPSKLVWRGAAVVAEVEAAAVAAVTEVVKTTAREAQANHPWQNRADLEVESIHSEVVVHPGRVVGKVLAASPALYLELGTSHARPFPFLRPAADANNPRLVGLMRASMI